MGLPLLAQRLDDQARGASQHPPTHYLRTRLLYDTCSFHSPALRATAETVGVERPCWTARHSGSR